MTKPIPDHVRKRAPSPFAVPRYRPPVYYRTFVDPEGEGEIVVIRYPDRKQLVFPIDIGRREALRLAKAAPSESWG